MYPFCHFVSYSFFFNLSALIGTVPRNFFLSLFLMKQLHLELVSNFVSNSYSYSYEFKFIFMNDSPFVFIIVELIQVIPCVPDRRSRSIPEVVLSKALDSWGSGNLEGGGFG